VSTPALTRGTYLGVVADRRWDRLRRKKRDDAQPAGPPKESVDLSDEEHAWWAARDELETGRVPHGRKRRSTADEPTKSGFETYYSSESLFDWTGDEAGMIDETDPYVVLGLPTSATWDQISSAHRRLAKLHHPDRLGDATPEERESSDERIRELNIAYMELRRRKGR
jgi:DnaJ-domain-containing protein 1